MFYFALISSLNMWNLVCESPSSCRGEEPHCALLQGSHSEACSHVEESFVSVEQGCGIFGTVGPWSLASKLSAWCFCAGWLKLEKFFRLLTCFKAEAIMIWFWWDDLFLMSSIWLSLFAIENLCNSRCVAPATHRRDPQSGLAPAAETFEARPNRLLLLVP